MSSISGKLSELRVKCNAFTFLACALLNKALTLSFSIDNALVQSASASPACRREKLYL